jgi:hypothetical protein
VKVRGIALKGNMLAELKTEAEFAYKIQHNNILRVWVQLHAHFVDIYLLHSCSFGIVVDKLGTPEAECGKIYVVFVCFQLIHAQAC